MGTLTENIIPRSQYKHMMTGRLPTLVARRRKTVLRIALVLYFLIPVSGLLNVLFGVILPWILSGTFEQFEIDYPRLANFYTVLVWSMIKRFWPMMLLAFVCSIPLYIGLVISEFRLKKKVLDKNGLVCPCCGYWLIHLPSPHNCPECGLNYDTDQIKTVWQEWISHLTDKFSLVLTLRSVKRLQFSGAPLILVRRTEILVLIQCLLLVALALMVWLIPALHDAGDWLLLGMVALPSFFLWGPFWWFTRRLKRRVLAGHPICPRCGISLADHPDQSQCPKCGIDYTKDQIRIIWENWFDRTRLPLG